jgi:hypothetical protein
MKLIKKFKSRPNLIDENCLVLLQKIIAYTGPKGHYKLTNVTPGLATLLDKNFLSVNYYQDRQIALLNPTIKDVEIQEISCNEGDLSKLYCELRKGN